jgi:hypothetical protein
MVEWVISSLSLLRTSYRQAGRSQWLFIMGAKTARGLGNSRIAHIFRSIRQRCENTKHKSYKYYGAKGIKCEWRSFNEFLEDMYESYVTHVAEFGERDTTIDRIKPTKSYSKHNCRWATYREQARNRGRTAFVNYKGNKVAVGELAEKFGMPVGLLRSRVYGCNMSLKRALTAPNNIDHRLITFAGKTQNLTAWAHEYGIPMKVLHQRLSRNWPLERALNTPLRRW